MELTRTDAVFSRIAMVFLRRNKSSRNDLEIYKIFFGIYKKYWRKNYLEGRSQEPTSPGGTTPLAAPGRLVRPSWLRRLQLQLYLVPFVRKKIKEKSSSRFAIRRRRHHLFVLWRADLESVLGSGYGRSSPSSSPTFLHRKFHDALHRS